MDGVQITVNGYDRNNLDLSQLRVDATLTVTAVPEPGTLALWLAGLDVMALRAGRAG